MAELPVFWLGLFMHCIRTIPLKFLACIDVISLIGMLFSVLELQEKIYIGLHSSKSIHVFILLLKDLIYPL